MSNLEYWGYGYLVYSVIFLIFSPKMLAMFEKDNWSSSPNDGSVTWRYVFRGLFLSLIPTMNLALPCGALVCGMAGLYENITSKKWLDKKVFK